MKQLTWLGLLWFALTGCTPAAPQFEASNPLDIAFGDPYILKASDGLYYMYGTGGVEDGFIAYSSPDLKSWTPLGQIYRGGTEDSWTVDTFWAPEVYERNGRYYMFFSANCKFIDESELERFRIGVAVADSPAGPFVDYSDKPLYDPGYPIIDANVYFEGERCWLYFSRCCYKHPVESEIAADARAKGMFEEIEESWVYGVELAPDFRSIIGEPVLLLQPPYNRDDAQAEWESRSVTSGEVNRRWTEGSFLFKHNDCYYMMYSANFYGGKHYAIGYATADNPLGPFVKSAHNPILQKNTEQGGDVTGTGHNSITIAPDGKTMLCVYHGRTTPTGDERMVFIDPMEVTESGELKIHGPSTRTAK